ncbi:nucleotide exchange factor GrpE [Agilicoccus flavus]|uniref:nucleotide exchange factor GrpE n=1 Tax=Agilicoccus flavus TaxID=2775968 RepID=UPI0027D9D835|nr:nucleotide exchange factor GrpE [Agilicoccus flavus]
MTDAGRRAGSSAAAGGPAPADGEGFVFRDKRRIDPQTGHVRGTAGAAQAAPVPHRAPGQKEANMTDQSGREADDRHETMAEGDDSFGGAVGDQLPGDDRYRGRHTRPGEGDGVATEGGETTVPGVPAGWPTPEGDLPPARPTSPAASAASEAAARAAYENAPKGTQPGAGDASVDPGSQQGGAEADANAVLAAERLADLQRLQAEYVNYKRRVDRDREIEKSRTVGSVIESLLPVLDEIHLARQHGELESGPFAKIAAKLEGVLAKQGVERYGEPGETFDPTVHEAIMHTQAELAPGTTDTTVVQVMQPGYRVGGRVVRAALVAVADPQ